MRAYVNIDTVSRESKPQNEEIGKIKYSIMDSWKEMSIEEIAFLVGENYHGMMPGNLVGGIKSENCKAMQLFVLDFDGSCTFEEIKRRADNYDLEISFVYHTYSSSPESERFRVVFAAEYLIEDIKVIKIITHMLYTVFPECDSSCKNMDRIFWGGKKLIYLDEYAALNFGALLYSFYDVINRNGNRSRTIHEFCKKFNICEYNNRPLIAIKEALHDFDEILDSTIIHNIEGSRFSSFFIAENIERHQHSRQKNSSPPRRLQINSSSNCKLLNDFLNGEDIGHNGKFLLMTNLMCINGGKKKFFEVLEEFSPESVDKWKRDIFYMKTYKPMSCDTGFCCYCNECSHAKNMVMTLAMDKKIIYEPEVLYSLDEAWSDMKSNLYDAFECKEDGIYVIKAQTSIGKTHAVIDLISDTLRRNAVIDLISDALGRNSEIKFIVAAPTNRLKHQIATDIKKWVAADEVFVTPSLENNKYIPDFICERIKSYHKQGIHKKTASIIAEYLDTIKDDERERAAIIACNEILKGMKALKEERVIVTTHAYLLNLDKEFLQEYTVIIDEDILQLNILNQTNKICISTLETLVERNVPGYSNIAYEMIHGSKNYYHCLNQYTDSRCSSLELDDLDDIDGISCYEDENVGDLLYAKTYLKTEEGGLGEEWIYYFAPKTLPRGKYILLSATVNSHIYGLFFKNQMKIFYYPDQKKARYKGRLVQYPYYSVSKTMLKESTDFFDKAIELSGGNKDINIITYNNFDGKEFLTDVEFSDIHFGNSTGINALKGQDILIIGTFYKRDFTYKLAACYLGADVNSDKDKNPRPRRVNYNGRSFIFTTYEDPLLQEFQLYCIESEMEQCVGRARLLREDCTVYLFSSFPCDQAEIHLENYMK